MAKWVVKYWSGSKKSSVWEKWFNEWWVWVGAELEIDLSGWTKDCTQTFSAFLSSSSIHELTDYTICAWMQEKGHAAHTQRIAFKGIKKSFSHIPWKKFTPLWYPVPLLPNAVPCVFKAPFKQIVQYSHNLYNMFVNFVNNEITLMADDLICC